MPTELKLLRAKVCCNLVQRLSLAIIPFLFRQSYLKQQLLLVPLLRVVLALPLEVFLSQRVIEKSPEVLKLQGFVNRCAVESSVFSLAIVSYHCGCRFSTDFSDFSGLNRPSGFQPRERQRMKGIAILPQPPSTIRLRASVMQITTGGTSYNIKMRLDRVRSEPVITITTEPANVKNGTSVCRVRYPAARRARLR